MQLAHNLEVSSPDTLSAPGEQDDVQLIKACQQGDQDAFATLVQRYQRRVFNISLRMLQDEADADEITQEAFLAAWQGLPAFRGEACFMTWLYRITYHCCLRQLERRKQERSLQVAIQDEQFLESVSTEQLAEDLSEQYGRQAMVNEQIEKLSARYRVVLILRHFQEMTYEEMATTLSLPIGTIKTHLFRARKLLKKRLLRQNLYGTELQKSPDWSYIRDGKKNFA
ncbi:MAG TPA: sigma-70 family RNA polymerase sigma factor [Ktedonobacteraceae bacterium]